MCKFHAWTKIHFQVRRLMTLLFLAGAKLLSILIFFVCIRNIVWRILVNFLQFIMSEIENIKIRL